MNFFTDGWTYRFMMVVATSCLITSIMIVWFRTNAVVEYLKLLDVVKLFKVAQETNVELTFLQYLKTYYNCFFVRLITCKYCLAAQLTFIFSIWLIIMHFDSFFLKTAPITYILSLALYKYITDGD